MALKQASAPSQSPDYAAVADAVDVDEGIQGQTALEEGQLGAWIPGSAHGEPPPYKRCTPLKTCGGCCGLSALCLVLFVVVSNLTAKPVTDDVSVFLDGWTQTPIPRKLVARNTSELLYEWRIEEAGIKAIAEGSVSTQVLLPIAKMLQADFLRTNHMSNVTEHGISRQMWFPNPISVFGDRVDFGLMEKMHVRSYEGRWSQKSLEQVQQVRRDRGSLTRWFARTMRDIRGVLVHMFLFQPTGLTSAFLDDDVLSSEADHVKEHAGVPTERTVDGMAAMIAAMEVKSRSVAGRPKYELSADNCMHFDKDPAVKLTEEGAYLPLDKMLVAHKGQTVFAPRREFSMNTGVAVFKLDEGGQVLRLYYAARAEFMLNDALDKDAEPPTTYVAPSDFGSELYAGADGRSSGGARSWVAWTIHWMYSSIPVDYEYLHLDAQRLCPESIHDRLGGTMSSKDMVAFVKSEKTLSQGFSLARLFSRTTVCGTEYLGAGSNERSASFEIDNMHGYDFLEAAVWAHAFLELPPHIRATTMTNREWNDFPDA